MDPTTLETIWFLLICILWIGYFVLEGFDFGVGLLLRAVGRDRAERRMLMHSIGPFWDGNEVWLLVAGGATFAAFPGWYASLFSGAYLALFVILAALIARGVAFEFWGKHDTPRWRATWEWSLIVGSAVPALLWGVAWANIVRGLPFNASHDMTGSFFDLLSPYALLGGVVSLALFTLHGAIFLTLRLDAREAADAHRRAEKIAAARRAGRRGRRRRLPRLDAREPGRCRVVQRRAGGWRRCPRWNDSVPAGTEAFQLGLRCSQAGRSRSPSARCSPTSSRTRCRRRPPPRTT